MLGSEPTGGQVAVVRDYDFHPLDDLRRFPMPEPGVPRLDGRAFVAVVRYGDIVVWHDTFADHWFKVNVTTDLDAPSWRPRPRGGAPVHLQLRHRHPNGAQGDAVLAVELFLDVGVLRSAPDLLRTAAAAYWAPWRTRS